MASSALPRKVFRFSNRDTETRTLTMDFKPELVLIEKMSITGLRPFHWPHFHVEDRGTIKITLPPGEYRITVLGLRFTDIERWENEGGHE